MIEVLRKRLRVSIYLREKRLMSRGSVRSSNVNSNRSRYKRSPLQGLILLTLTFLVEFDTKRDEGVVLSLVVSSEDTGLYTS